MEAAANTTIASLRAATKVEIREEIISAVVLKVVEATEEAPRAVADNKERIRIIRDHRPQTPSNNNRLSNHRILSKRSSRALLPRKIIRKVDKVVKISKKTDLKQLRLNKLQYKKSLKRKKRARLLMMEAGVQ